MHNNRVDYTKNFNSEDSVSVVEEAETVISEPIVENSNVEAIHDISDEVKDPNELVVAKVDLQGKATHLNIRSNPSIGDNEIKTIPDGEEIMVYINEDNGDWAKIVTASGVEGFVMKSFVIFES